MEALKSDPEAAARVCAVALHGAVASMAALTPVTPSLSARFAAAIGLDALTWEHADARWQPEKVVAPETLLARMDMAAVEAMVEQSRAESAPAEETPDYAVDVEAFSDEITFDDFAKVDLRIGVVEEASFVEGARSYSYGTAQAINVFAGVRSAYPVERPRRPPRRRRRPQARKSASA